MLKINNVTIATPSAMEVALVEIGDARRNAAGQQVIDRIALKQRLRLSWNYLDGTVLSGILSALDAQPFCAVEYPDPVTGQSRSVLCSCESHVCGVLRQSDSATGWKNVEIVLMER